MVEYDAVLQAFDKQEDISINDVMLFVNRDTVGEQERFGRSVFLPPYLAEAESKLYSVSSLGGLSDEEVRKRVRFMDSDDCRFRKNDKQNILLSITTAETFVCLAFDLFELLQNPSEHDVNRGTLQRFGAYQDTEQTAPDGFADFAVSFDIPACDYLAFMAEGCERVSKKPIWTDCILEPLGGDTPDPLIGWITSRHGARLTYGKRVPDNPTGYRMFLQYFLKFLLDLHLHDVQMVTYGLGDYSMMATHALAALWVKLREEFAGGRAYVCRVCGKHSVAHGERKEKARYCESRGSCAQAFARTKRVLEAINDGVSVDEAVKAVPGIKLERVTDIALRNRFVFANEFPNVDFDKLAERR